MTYVSFIFSLLFFIFLVFYILTILSRTTDFGSPDKKEEFEWIIKWVSRFLFSVKAETCKLHDRVPDYKLGVFRQLVFLACWSAHAEPCSVVWSLFQLKCCTRFFFQNEVFWFLQVHFAALLYKFMLTQKYKIWNWIHDYYIRSKYEIGLQYKLLNWVCKYELYR